MVNFYSYVSLPEGTPKWTVISCQKKTGKIQVVVMVLSLASGEMLSQFAGSTVDFSTILDNHWLVVDLPL